MKTIPLLTNLFIACALAVLSSTRTVAQSVVNNATGGAIGLIDIQGPGGEAVATVYVSGKGVTFGPNQTITKGAGYVQAAKDKHFRISLFAEYKKKGETNAQFNQFLLKLDRIEWDENGKTTAITIADPKMESSSGTNIHIKSNLQAVLHDGLLLLDTEGAGKISANIKFGGYSGFNRATAETDLTWAVCQGDLESIKTLVAKSDPNGANGNGETALHKAAQNGSEDIVQLLLANKADVNAKDSKGWTPLHEAAVAGHKRIAELLLGKKADVNAKTSSNDTPLILATWKGNKDVVDLLLANKADVNAPGSGGNTAIYLAANWGYKDIVDLLIAHNCDVNTKTEKGETPLQGVSKDHPEIAEMLRQHGAHE